MVDSPGSCRLRQIPVTEDTLVLRTDFSDEYAWDAIAGLIREPVGEFRAHVELVSDRETKAKFPPHAKIASRLNEQFKKHGLILRVSNEIINIGPPLCITRNEIDTLVRAIDLALGAVERDLGMRP